jgi:endonuclease/exonuclease/phosphatase family metal-dependent hydrolase
MKKNIDKLYGALVLSLLAAGPLSAQYSDTVKIMTYNINYESNKNTQYEGIITVIKAIDPTIAGLQKLDSCMGTGSIPCYVPKLLGDATSMSYTFVTGAPTSYGDGFLTKQPPKSVRKIKLTGGSATMARVALEIGVTVAGEPVRVIVTHLDLTAANRTAEVQQIIAWMDSGGAKTIPAVIMADFNAGPTEDCMTQLTDVGFVFLKTSTGVILDTAQKINHILYRPENRWKIVDVGNPKYAASNRYPLWALMQLLNPVSSMTKMPAKTGLPASQRLRFNGREIGCNLSERAVVTIRLYDPSGRMVRTLMNGRLLEAGNHSFGVSNIGLTKGMYFLESLVNGSSAVEKIAIDR